VPVLARRSPLRLLIIDSVAALFRGDFSSGPAVRACVRWTPVSKLLREHTRTCTCTCTRTHSQTHTHVDCWWLRGGQDLRSRASLLFQLSSQLRQLSVDHGLVVVVVNQVTVRCLIHFG
jgi:RecA/RadA recombinase